jgi:type VI secretion system secreted protein Hcp
VATTLPGSGAGGGLGDMFLSIKGAKSGVIKGESQDSAHQNEIDVVSWSWALQSKSSLGGGAATGKAVAQELKIVKRVDCASTPLMSALRSNELITKAVLTLRKAGRTALEFLRVTIEDGRVTSIAIDAGGERAGNPEIFENVNFTFNKITVEYVPQGKDGQALGSMTFQDQFGDT